MDFKIVKRSRIPRGPSIKHIDFFSQALETTDPVRTIYRNTVSLIYKDNADCDITRLTEQAATIYFVQLLNLEILNGGFNQFFSNCSGNYINETAQALEKIEAPLTQQIFSEALLLLDFDPEQSQQDTQAKISKIDPHCDIFLPLEKEYYKNINSGKDEEEHPENLWYLSFSYIKKHLNARISR